MGEKRRSRSGKARRRGGRVVGLGTAVGVFLALAMTPLATAPRAHADIDDLIFQPIIDAVDQATSLAGPSLLGAFDSGLDVDSLLTPALATAGSVDPTDVLGFSDPLAALDALSTDLFQALAYDPVHEIGELWITSPFGQTLDPIINMPFVELTGRELIGTGIPGTLASPDGGSAGWLFGDGGAGLIGNAGNSVAATDGGIDGAVGAAAPVSASVPLQMYADTEPLVNVSVGGGPTVPVVVDTGSAGLVMPIWDLGLQNIGFPTGLGIGEYSGGLDYVYLTIPSTVSFGNDIVTGQTGVDAVLFSFPTTLSGPWTLHDFLAPDGAEGVLGIGPNAVGPTPDDIPTMALPGDLNQGVLINEPAHELVFGPPPSTLGDGVSVAGAPNTTLGVQIGEHGDIRPVSTIVDSGGVYGTIPSSVLGGASQVPVGTQISVYTSNGEPLYSYVTTLTNSPTVTSGGMMNTGYVPFAQHPVYIDNNLGTTTFYP